MKEPGPDPYGAIRLGHQKGVSKVAVPLGTIVLRISSNKKQLVRMVKVRMDGPPQKRWMEYARWWWEKNRGPVPPGKLVLHMDGDALNDEPANIAVGTAGDKIAMAHLRDPEWSRKQHEGAAAACAEHNRLRGQIFNLRNTIMSNWYPVWDAEGIIFSVAFRKRKALYAWFGADVRSYPSVNGASRKALEQIECVVRPVRGRDLKAGILDSYARVAPEFQISTGKDNFSAKEDRRMDLLSKTGIWSRALEAARTPSHLRCNPKIYGGKPCPTNSAPTTTSSPSPARAPATSPASSSPSRRSSPRSGPRCAPKAAAPTRSTPTPFRSFMPPRSHFLPEQQA